MEPYSILNCPCLAVETPEQIKDYIRSLISSGKGGYTVAINALKIVGYNNNSETRRIINQGIFHVPDGVGAVHALKLLHKRNSMKLDLPGSMLDLASQEKYRCFFLGASEDSNSKAYDKVASMYPGINRVGRLNGYFKEYSEVRNAIKESNPQVVLLALGSPKQEHLSNELLKEFPHILFVGCGGRFDILAGKLKRAPKWIVENNFEWLYRLLLEPRKRIKMQLALGHFMVLLYKYYIRIRIKKKLVF